VSPIEVAPDGTASFVISAPIEDADGELLGVLRVRYAASVLQDLITQNSGAAGVDSYAFLVDENGFRLADGKQPDLFLTATTWLSDERLTELRIGGRIPLASMDQLYNNLPDLEQALEQAPSQPTFSAIAYPGDGVSQGAVANLQTQPWRVVYIQPQTTFLQPVQEQTRLNAIVTMLIAALVTASAIGLAQVLAAPINRLTETAEKVRAGDLHAEARVEAQDEIGTLAATFNSMTGQLRTSLAGLEQRVEDRTRALAISADISRRISSILDQQQLIAEVVEQLRSAFNYYHVHIYLYDDRREHLLMAGGTGEAARTMLARGHRLEEGRGLVGRAAGTNSPVLVPDVAKDPGWVPNALLPDTRSEMAVPISLGSRVLGVLDVQHNVVNGLKQDDVQLIQSVSNQVAIALQNTLSFQRTQYEAQRETIINSVSEKIQHATTIESVLQIATRELGQALHAQRANVSISRAHITNPHSEHTNPHS
jgi:putative methionine-R-sulfoxide reductase with GAF domain